MPTIAETHAALTARGQPFEMEWAPVLGANIRVWKNAPPSLRAILEMSAAHTGEFLVYEDRRLTYPQHYQAVCHLATLLVDRYGVRPGDRVAIVMRNLPEWPVAFWAAAAVGGVVVPLNAWWTAPELEYGLRDSGATVAFLDRQRYERLAGELPSLDLRAIVVGASCDVAPAERWEDAVGEIPSTAVLPDVEIAPDDLATIFYTSGTTGRPKGALGTHRNICTNLISLMFASYRTQLRAGQEPAPPAAPPVYLLSVPLFHATGCHSVLVASMVAGGTLVLMHHWDPERALELIERERVTTFGGVPTMAWQVLQSPSLHTRDTSSVLSISYGGAPAAPELVRRIAEHFPGRIPGNGYGLTETSSVTTMNTGVDYQRKPDSVGVPVAVCDVRVVDDEGRDLPVGEVGELWIQGPNIVVGYWGNDEATEKAFADRWFRSGDLARLDDEGFVYVVDRAKDMLIRGGENVYCAEVEAALFEHPDVLDAGVIGVPHQQLGEEIGAVVVLRPGAAATIEDLRAHVAERLASFKVPAHVFLRPGPLPRNPAGKLLKREIRDDVLKG